MKNEQVVKIVSEYYEKGNAEEAAEKLVSEARNIWRTKFTTIDDITALVLYFNF